MDPTDSGGDAEPLPRRTGLLTLIFVGVVAVVLAGAALWPDGDTVPLAEVGQLGVAGQDERAPDFTVRLIDGSTFTLSDHLATDGRPVVLNFWASWCAPCRAEMPEFDQVASEKPGLLVLGVAVQDSEANARDFAEEIGVSYPLGIDTSETVAASYRFLGLPATWLINSDGTIVRQVNGQIDADALRQMVSGSFGL